MSSPWLNGCIPGSRSNSPLCVDVAFVDFSFRTGAAQDRLGERQGRRADCGRCGAAQAGEAFGRVQWQHCNVLGKQPNFQMLVSLTLTQKKVSGPIALRPYEPKIGRRTKRVVQEWR